MSLSAFSVLPKPAISAAHQTRHCLRLHVVTASPEIDAPNDTFACRFYARVAQLPPCEGKIIPVFRTVHVFLKLTYKDPEDPAGKTRDFPPEVPVIVDDGKGTALDGQHQSRWPRGF